MASSTSRVSEAVRPPPGPEREGGPAEDALCPQWARHAWGLHGGQVKRAGGD